MDTQDALETTRMLYTLYLMDANKAASYLRRLVNGAYQDGFDAALDIDPRAGKRQRKLIQMPSLRHPKFRGEEI